MKLSKSILIENTLYKQGTTIKILQETDTEDIEVTNPGVLEIPEGKTFDTVGIQHYISLAKKIGKDKVMPALLNLERWNKNKNPDIAKKARKIIDSLLSNKEWESL